jgi:hypothetical protein
MFDDSVAQQGYRAFKLRQLKNVRIAFGVGVGC